MTKHNAKLTKYSTLLTKSLPQAPRRIDLIDWGLCLVSLVSYLLIVLLFCLAKVFLIKSHLVCLIVSGLPRLQSGETFTRLGQAYAGEPQQEIEQPLGSFTGTRARRSGVG